MIKTDFPQVKLIANEANLGFAKANNQAIKQAQGEYILLLNPDMRLPKDNFAKMISWFEANPQAAVAGCKLLDEQGNLINHVRRFPRLSDQLAIILKIPHLWPKILDSYLAKDFEYGKPAKVDSIRGSYFLMRRINGKMPLLDERYFVWFEEVDYCRQMRKDGLEVWYAPAAEAFDSIGASFSQIKKGQAQDYFRASMIAYFTKWHPAWQCAILNSAWPIGRLLAVFANRFKINDSITT
jgi:GT2 family glycosyltransferase